MNALIQGKPPLKWYTVEYTVKITKRIPADSLEQAGKLARAFAVADKVTLLSVKSIEALLQEQQETKK